MDNFEDEKVKKKQEFITKLGNILIITFLEGVFVYIATLIFMCIFYGDVKLDWFVSIVWSYMITTFILTYRNYGALEERIKKARNNQ